MNHFAEGNFSQSQSTFFPKKSFNKIVNLNLLNSKEFVENYVKNQDDEGDDQQQKQLNDFIKKSMKFYSKIQLNRFY
jgi:DNA-binding transcriptional regulator GbsR (MarR family)